MLCDRRLTRVEIAKSLGIDVSTLYTWSSGGNPDACPGFHAGGQVLGLAGSRNRLPVASIRHARDHRAAGAQRMLLLLDDACEGSPEGALLLLMRWPGLSICNTDRLRRGDAHALGEQVLRCAKSGELVTVQLPHLVLEALTALPEREAPLYLDRQAPCARPARSTGGTAWGRPPEGPASGPSTRSGLGITFAVGVLLPEVAIHHVSTLMGHTSVRTPKRLYTAWNTARRNRLARIVGGAHRKDSVLRELARESRGGCCQYPPSTESLVTHTKPAADGATSCANPA